MNTTVKRIVELLFEDVVMTEETEAIRDEGMNNCQERYAALIADGYTEDDAVGAVVESLKGMDEVLKDYPKVTKVDDSAAFRKDEAEDGVETPEIPWDIVKNLQVNVKSADVSVVETDGSPYLSLTHGTRSRLNPRVEGDTLIVTQDHCDTQQNGRDSGHAGFFGALSRIFNVTISLGSDEGKMTLAVPGGLLRSAAIHSLSGDIRVEGDCGTLSLESASGDCSVALEDKTDGTGSLTAKSISGDVTVTGSFTSAKLSTTSGDVEFRGKAASFELSTVSGDGNADTASSHVKGNTVSGDLDIAVHCEDSTEIQLNTVSGDIGLRFPEGVKAINARTNTRSGDVEFHNVSLSDNAPVKVMCNSVSGEISIG